MHARVTTMQIDPSRIDDAIRQLEQEEVPRWQELDGFKGATILVDRDSGKLNGTTYWESQEQMQASEDAVSGSRERAAEAGGAAAAPNVERFEVAVDTQV